MRGARTLSLIGRGAGSIPQRAINQPECDGGGSGPNSEIVAMAALPPAPTINNENVYDGPPRLVAVDAGETALYPGSNNLVAQSAISMMRTMRIAPDRALFTYVRLTQFQSVVVRLLTFRFETTKWGGRN